MIPLYGDWLGNYATRRVRDEDEKGRAKWGEYLTNVALDKVKGKCSDWELAHDDKSARTYMVNTMKSCLTAYRLSPRHKRDAFTHATIQGPRDEHKGDCLIGSSARQRTPCEEAIRRERINIVGKIVDELPSPDREIVEGKIYDGLPSKEIGHDLQMSEDAVNTRYTRAKKRIKKRAQDHGIEL